MTDRLSAAGFDFERLSAVDGRTWLADFDHDARKFIYDEKFVLRRFGRALGAGEIGCFLSHVSAARRFLETEARWCLVLEDDAQLEPGSASKLKKVLDALPPDIDCVNMGRAARHSMAMIDPHIGLVRAFYFPVTTTALLWSRKGAQAFLDTAFPIACPIDLHMQKIFSENGRGAALLVPLFPTSDVESTIANGTRKNGTLSFTYHPLRILRISRNRVNAVRAAFRMARE